VFIVAVFGIFEHTALGRTFDHWIEYKLLVPLIG
jgi:hypothetical protein